MPKTSPDNRNSRFADFVIRWMSHANTLTYRVSRGRIGGRFNGAPVALLTTIGRKSGEPRVVPLLYLRDGARVILVASRGGTDKHPLWYLNLRANPRVDIQIGSHTSCFMTHEASEAERADYWPKLESMYPSFVDYRARTARQIPIIICEPSSAL